MSDTALSSITRQSLDNIRQRLLDLSKRNQLLSYKEKVRTVHIVDTPLEKIFNKLVREGKSMTFVAQPTPVRKTTGIINVSCETLITIWLPTTTYFAST